VPMQPHWRHDTHAEPVGPGAATNQQAGLTVGTVGLGRPTCPPNGGSSRCSQ
jgi:hypothetical protein